MPKKNLLIIIILLVTIILFFTIKFNITSDKQEQESRKNNNNTLKKDDKNMETINVTIKGINYTLSLENNETTKAFLNELPLTITMSELNGNEKYYYLDKTLPSSPSIPNRIEKGDVMLYGNNCIVIFYKSFNTSYSYTKIGKIYNLPDLGTSSIEVTFSK